MPKGDEQEKRRLLRYFLGDPRLSPEEEEEVRERLRADLFWQSLSGKEIPHGREEIPGTPTDWDTQGELRKLKDRLGFAPEEAEHPGRSAKRPARATRPAHRSPRHRRRATAPFLRVAAALVLVACAVTLIEVLWAPFGSAREGMNTAARMRIVTTEEGQRASIRLADGTQVMLSVDSELRIPASMGRGTSARDVYLEGEAYFEVAPDATRPFRVHAGGAVIRVLGTVFGVRAYPEDEERRVVVAEGHVAIRSAQAATKGGVHLTRGQLGRWRRQHTGAVRVTQHVEVERYLAWRSGRLVFDSTPLHEVVTRLERWYAVDIQLVDTTLTGRSFTGSFAATTPADEVLATVAFAFDLRYRKEGPTVILRSPSP